MYFAKFLTHTESAILAALWNWRGLQRRELCHQLGLSRPTVERALRKLADLDLIHSESSPPPRRGRPAQIFRVVPHAWTTLGMDFELPEVNLVLCNAVGDCVQSRSFELRENLNRPHHVLSQLAQEIVIWMNEHDLDLNHVQGLGIGLPGFLTPQGVSFVGRNLPQWESVPVRELLTEQLSIPVLIRHDVQLIALAEVEQRGWHGAITLFAAVRPGLAGELRIGAAVCMRGLIYAGGHGNGGALYRAVVEEEELQKFSQEKRLHKIADRLVESLIHAIPLIDPDRIVLHADCMGSDEPALRRLCQEKLQMRLQGEYIGLAEIAPALARGSSGAEKAALAVTRQLLGEQVALPHGISDVPHHQDLLTTTYATQPQRRVDIFESLRKNNGNIRK